MMCFLGHTSWSLTRWALVDGAIISPSSSDASPAAAQQAASAVWRLSVMPAAVTCAVIAKLPFSPLSTDRLLCAAAWLADAVFLRLQCAVKCLREVDWARCCSQPDINTAMVSLKHRFVISRVLGCWRSGCHPWRGSLQRSRRIIGAPPLQGRHRRWVCGACV